MGTLHPAIRKSIQFREEIPEDIRIIYPRLHFCSSWDFLLINDDDPEFECCDCFYKDGKHWVILDEECNNETN